MTISEQVVKAMPERIYAAKKTEGSNCVVSFDTPSLDYNVEYVRADLVPFLPVQGAVKKLAWTKGVVDIAQPMPGMKYVACNTTPKGSWAWWLDNAPETRGVFTSEEAAKAAAQADYEARILSTLEPSPARELALEEGYRQGIEDAGQKAAEMLVFADTTSTADREIAAAIRTLSSPDHADAGKLAGADRPSVKGTIPTAFGDSVCFSGIDHSALILVSVRGNSGLVPIKYLLPHQLYVHDVQKLSEQGEVLVCAVPVYDQQINVTSAIPSAPSEGAE